jgi:hypothetical protein
MKTLAYRKSRLRLGGYRAMFFAECPEKFVGHQRGGDKNQVTAKRVFVERDSLDVAVEQPRKTLRVETAPEPNRKVGGEKKENRGQHTTGEHAEGPQLLPSVVLAAEEVAKNRRKCQARVDHCQHVPACVRIEPEIANDHHGQGCEYRNAAVAEVEARKDCHAHRGGKIRDVVKNQATHRAHPDDHRKR